jgi:frataxin-like iron-binding protein CyaY
MIRGDFSMAIVKRDRPNTHTWLFQPSGGFDYGQTAHRRQDHPECD